MGKTNVGPIKWFGECENPFCDFSFEVSDNESERASRLAHGRALVHESTGETHDVSIHRPPVKSDSSPHDGGMRLCGEVESEAELQEWLKDFFESNGWTAIREVSPSELNYSADLIVEHDDYCKIGIETKYFKQDGGAKLADAHHQLTRKYRSRK